MLNYCICTGWSQDVGIYYDIYHDAEAKVDRAKLFENGRSQAVRLPKAYRFEGDEVFLKKVGDAVMLYPATDFWDDWFCALEDFSSDFMNERDQPTSQDRKF